MVQKVLEQSARNGARWRSELPESVKFVAQFEATNSVLVCTLQDRLQALENEIGQRDQLEGQIDGKMLALFSRLKALEDANVRLEQANEGLRQKAGIQE